MRCFWTKSHTPLLKRVYETQTQHCLRLQIDPINSERCKFHTLHEGNKHTWSVLNYLYQRQLKQTKKNYACFLLNITDKSFQSFERNKHIWDDADLKVVVDGSANCLARKKLLHTADVLSGDFDSIDPNLLVRIQSPRKAIRVSDQESSSDVAVQKPIVVETPCQKETDFTKAIRVALSLKPDIHNFFGLYFLDGHRIDHLFGLINTLHLIKKNTFIVNIKSNTVSWLLQPGTHTILKPLGQELCSLVPFTGPAQIRTQGLRYNLNLNQPSSFGALISTSNICSGHRGGIVVETDRELLWSIDMLDENLKQQNN